MTSLRERFSRGSRISRYAVVTLCLALFATFASAPSAAQAATGGAKFYVDPSTDAAQAVASLKTSDPSEAAELSKIADQSTAIWLGEWNSDPTTVVDSVLTDAQSQQAVPVFVLYAIPDRDCGGYSEGGFSTDAEYETFVKDIAAGVKGRTTVFVVEPDALPMEDSCLDAAQQADRESLINFASKTLSVPNSYVYLDAGDPGWQTQATMATRLKAAGIQYDQGFSLNVSAFDTTAAQEAYGNVLSADVGYKHFVIDTSRNGNGLGTTWCNPPGRALGTPPTQQTDDGLVDAYLWIKSPGQSDGNCNGGPASGVFWTAYALELAENASF